MLCAVFQSSSVVAIPRDFRSSAAAQVFLSPYPFLFLLRSPLPLIRLHSLCLICQPLLLSRLPLLLLHSPPYLLLLHLALRIHACAHLVRFEPDHRLDALP